MKRMNSVMSFVASISAAALMATQLAPITAHATTVPSEQIDLAIVRAASAPLAAPVVTAPAMPVNSGTASGGDEVEDDTCIVKFFEPEVLKTYHRYDKVVLVNAKLICEDEVGVAELLIEQNDQIVVAQTVENFQTDVSLLSATVKLTDEQEETFCVSVARDADGDGDFAVIAQECWYDLGYGD